MGQRLGQHFLRSQKALDTILEAGDTNPGDFVLEIGPGEGVLTRYLLGEVSKVIAIEKDETLCIALRETFSDEIAAGKLELIEGDVLDFEPNIFKAYVNEFDYKLIANIPYYITGAIIRKFLTAKVQPERMVLLVQKEIAERIARDRKESILSLSVKAYGSPRYIAKVPKGSFAPPPKVDSAILLIENISREFFKEIREEFFFEIVRLGFSSKRKMLAGNLSARFSKETIREAFSHCGLDAKVRAEDISIEKWQELVQLLSL
jgi:16S rRNA (adenine1518-N6/adenine1519-N6)-dimethyltransferase